MGVAKSNARPHSHHHVGRSAAAAAPAASVVKPKLYNPRHPERTLLYQTIAEHFETWHELASAGQFDGQGDDCGHDFLVAFSCKGRGVCPSCNTRRMVETAAHLTDHVFPRLPVRQWVLSVPKRLRYFMQRDGAVLNMVLRIFLRAFVGRGLLESFEAKEMLAYKHSGFSVDAGVCIEAHDRAALERLLRYCARPPFAMERLRKEGAELHLTPLELIDRIAALVPPPRTHRHRYFGVLAPNSPHGAAVTALAALAQPDAGQRAAAHA